MPGKDFIPYTHADEKLVDKFVEKRHSAEVRFPLLITLLGTFGFVSTLYGFEKLIDKFDIFASHPWILLVIGVITLSVTGTLYKKL